MKKMQIVQKTLLVLMAAVLLLLSSGVGFAQTGKVVLEQGSAKIFQTSDGWEMYHGNERVAHGDGVLNIGNMPPAFKALFESIGKIPEANRINTRVSKASTVTYGPLIQSHWNQESPWNNLCPTIEYTDKDGVKKSMKAITGCTTISTCEVLNYYGLCMPIVVDQKDKYCRYPISATSNDYSITNVRTSDEYDETTYKYDCQMQYTPDFGKINSDNNEMAKFVVAVALIQNASFGTGIVDGGTSTSHVSQENCFTNVYGYSIDVSSSIQSINDGSYIETAIKQGRPVIASGGSHSYILDGWNGNEVHVDFGWGGYNNGWFTQEAYDQTGFTKGLHISVPYPKNFGTMQQTPKYVHIKGNGIDKKINMQLQSGLDYRAAEQLEAGTYEFYFEYADGNTIAPYTNSVIKFSQGNKEYSVRGSFLATPAQFSIPGKYTVEFTHNAASNEIKLNVPDFEITIAGKVLSSGSPVADAIVTTSPNRPTGSSTLSEPAKHEYTNPYPNGMGYVLMNSYTKKKINISEGAFLNEIEVYLWYRGNPTSVTMAVMNQQQETLWEHTLSLSEIQSGWVKFEPNGIVVSNSQDYYIALKSSTYESSNYFVYGIGEDQTMAYKIVVSDAFVAKTDKDGNYSVKVSNPFTGKLYAFANDLEFEPLSFKDASKNLTGQNFKTGSENIFNTISGKVLDEQSKGIAYAEVSLTADKQAAKTVKADANGAYSIDVEKNFTGNIYAFAEGYVFDPISVSKVSGVLTGKDFKGTSKYVTISGKVTDENNKGIPSAEVSLTSDKQADKTVKTAGDGSYSMQIEKNYSGKLYAFAYGRDFDPLTLSGVRTDLTNQNFKELPKFITISGTVTDASSKPLAGVAITNSKDKIVESLDAQIEATGQYYCATSTCPHCNNTFKLSQSYITKAEIKCYSRGNPGNLSLCIQNTQKETLWEKVLTPSDLSQYGEWTTVEVGFSVDVAKEYIIRLLPENKYTNTDYYAYATGGAEEKVAYRLYTGTDRAITDNKGNYSITIRRHSDVTLYAISDDAEFDPLTLNDVATNLTGKNFKAKATQPKTFTISGKVTDANSKAIAGAEVSLTADKQASKTVKADNNGNYTITVDRGFSGNLYAFANGYEFTTISISNVTANQTGKNFKGTEVQVFYTISGKVTDAASKAISGAEVSLSPDRPTGQTVKTDRNGTFSLTVEKNFIGKIYVFADGYNFEPLAISKVTADATGQVIKGVKLLITYTITGKVYDENYLAVADAEVSITTDRAVGKTVKTDNNGYYAISVEENFSGKLYAFANNYEFTPLTLNKVTANLTNQDFRGVEICDSKTVTISGKVMDVNYNPIAGAEVYTAVDGKTVTTLDKEKTSEGTIYMVDTRDFSRNYTANTFTPSENKIGRIEFKVQYWGTPGKLTLAVLDKSRKAVWQKDMSSDEISNDAWTAVDLDLAVTAGQQYYVALKENSTSNRCYAYYDTDADDGMVYKIYSLTGGQTRKSVQTNAAGEYSYEVDNGADVTLYVEYGNKMFNSLTLTQVRKNMLYQDIYEVGAADPNKKLATVSGKVLDVRGRGLANAWVTESYKAPEATSKFESAETCYSFKTKDMEFTAGGKYLTRVDFMISKQGNTGDLKVAILDGTKNELWSKTLTNDETTAWQWKEITLDQSIELTPGNSYFIRLQTSGSGTYYYVMDNANWDMVHRIWTSDSPCVKTNDQGEYQLKAEKGTSATLHAYYEDMRFNVVTYENLSSNLSGQDFRVYTAAALPGEKTVQTPVSEIAKASNIKVWSYESTIYIEGANVGTVFSITDNMGRIVINKSEVKSTREEIVPGASGVMIIRIGQQSFKVFVE